MDDAAAQAALKEADARYAAGDHPRALAQLRELVAARPDFGAAHCYLGFLLASGFDRLYLDEGIAELRRAVALDGGWQAHHNLGDALFARGLIDESLGEYRQAVAASNGSPPVTRFGIAQCLELRGELRGALSELRRASRSDDDPRRRYLYGLSACRIEEQLRRAGTYFVAESEQASIDAVESPEASPDESADDVLARLPARIEAARAALAQHRPPFLDSALRQLDAIGACVAARRPLVEYAGRAFLFGLWGIRELEGRGQPELQAALTNLQWDWDKLRRRWYRAER